MRDLGCCLLVERARDESTTALIAVVTDPPRRSSAVLARGLVQADGGGRGDVERFAAARLRDGEHGPAAARHTVCNALPFVTEHPGAGPGQRELVEALAGVRAGAEQRNAEFAQHPAVDALDQAKTEVR